MQNPRVTRRTAGKAAVFALAPTMSAEELPKAIRDLELPEELRADLGPRVQRAIEEAGWLGELPLNGVAPGFLFRAE